MVGSTWRPSQCLIGVAAVDVSPVHGPGSRAISLRAAKRGSRRDGVGDFRGSTPFRAEAGRIVASRGRSCRGICGADGGRLHVADRAPVSWSWRPTISSRQPFITASFPDRCCASRRAARRGGHPQRHGYAGAGPLARPDDPERRRRRRRRRHAVRAGARQAARSRSCRSPRAFASTILTSSQAATSTAAPTPDKPDPFTSSRRDDPGAYDREVFLVLKEF